MSMVVELDLPNLRLGHYGLGHRFDDERLILRDDTKEDLQVSGGFLVGSGASAPIVRGIVNKAGLTAGSRLN